MNISRLHETLKDYIDIICREQGLYPKYYTAEQMGVMAEKMEAFASLCREDDTLLLFFYNWYSIRKSFPQKSLWEKAFKGSSISKEELEQMYRSWSSLEHTIIGFTRENKKLMERTKDYDLER